MIPAVFLKYKSRLKNWRNLKRGDDLTDYKKFFWIQVFNAISRPWTKIYFF